MPVPYPSRSRSDLQTLTVDVTDLYGRSLLAAEAAEGCSPASGGWRVASLMRPDIRAPTPAMVRRTLRNRPGAARPLP